MGVAIIGLFDVKLMEEIKELQRAIVEVGVSAHTFRSLIGPHMTFVGFETGSPDQAIDLAKRVTQTVEVGSIPVKISSYGIFPYKKKVVFAQPAPSQVWMELHRSILEYCLNAGEQIEEYHFSGNWVPHITLASRLTAEEVLLANEVLLGKFPVLQGKIDQLAIIDCEAEEILWKSRM